MNVLLGSTPFEALMLALRAHAVGVPDNQHPQHSFSPC
jgi:hypothetical protein